MIGCGYTEGEEEEPEGGAHPQREREERVGLGDDQPPGSGKRKV
jgi:hypothetical protein